MNYNLIKKAQNIADAAAELALELNAPVQSQQLTGVDSFSFLVSIFVLSCIIGYYVVWRVTPALHTPLMAVTNAISSIVIIGAIIASSAQDFGIGSIFGFIASMLAAINIFGGFVITQRMLAMFKKKTPNKG